MLATGAAWNMLLSKLVGLVALLDTIDAGLATVLLIMGATFAALLAIIGTCEGSVLKMP
jgi:hypothetical protein